VDTNWYIDTGATDHITSELEKLQIRGKYNKGDQIHNASGTGMDISHIGHTTVHTPVRNIHLKNVLYVPQAQKNLNYLYLSRISPKSLCYTGQGYEEHNS
jgi:histone deacetylase 1/2